MRKRELYKQIHSDLCHYARLKGASQNNLFALLCTAILSRGFWMIAFHRIQLKIREKLDDSNRFIAILPKLFCYISELVIRVLTKSLLDPNTYFGSKVYLSNKGNIIIGANMVGSESVIQHDVTIGMDITRSGKKIPDIGERVWIGSNSIIYGEITIGEGATICENTVLSRSIPENCLIGGNPAKVLSRNFDNSNLRNNPEEPAALKTDPSTPK